MQNDIYNLPELMKTDTEYVIQRHSLPDQVHWDLMIASGQALRTYRVFIPPEEMADNPATLEPIFDHPRRFLTYEGPVNKGRGSVQIADKGIVTISDKQGRTILEFKGRVLQGRFILREENQKWLLSPEPV